MKRFLTMTAAVMILLTACAGLPRSVSTDIPSSSVDISQSQETPEPSASVSASADVTSSGPAETAAEVPSSESAAEPGFDLTTSQVADITRKIAAPLAAYHGRFTDEYNQRIRIDTLAELSNRAYASENETGWDIFFYDLGIFYWGPAAGFEDCLADIVFNTIEERGFDAHSDPMFWYIVNTEEMITYGNNAFHLPQLGETGTPYNEHSSLFPTGSGDDPSGYNFVTGMDPAVKHVDASGLLYIPLQFNDSELGFIENITVILSVVEEPDNPFGCYITEFEVREGILDDKCNIMDPPLPADGMFFPDSDVRLITPAEIMALSPEQLGIARNEIFARHGNVFDSPFYQEYFAQWSWYTPTHKVDMDELSETERANVLAIQAHEQRY